MCIGLQKSVHVLIVGCRCKKRKGIIGAEIMDGQVLRISKVCGGGPLALRTKNNI